MKKFLSSILFIVFINVIIFIVPVAHADQPAINLTLSPIFFDLSATPGGKLQEKIRIKNNAGAPIALQIDVKKIVTDSQGNSTVTDPKTGDESLSYLTFTTPHFIAQPNVWTDIPFTISIPKTADFAYYWAIAFKSDVSVTGQNGAALSGQPAVPILLAVKQPGVVRNGEVINFKPKDFISENLPVDFETSFKNVGNVHIEPHGNIFIQSLGQSDLGILDVNNDLGRILPGETRTFISRWTDGFIVEEPVLDAGGNPTSDKNGQPITHLIFHWDKLTHFRIGPYNAHLVLVFDNGQRDQVLEASTTFWVIPYKIIGGILVVLIGGFLLIRKLLRNYIRSQIQKGNQGD